jgi:hypothetical protein
MRNLILAGAAALTLALGASSAFALPPNSPYALSAPQAVDQGTMSEGRAAYENRDSNFTWQFASPEDSTYYSRGR